MVCGAGAAGAVGRVGAAVRWTTDHASKAVMGKRSQGQPVVGFIKLAGTSLKDPNLLPWMSDILKAANAAPESIVLAVSETVATNNLKALKMLLAGLHEMIFAAECEIERSNGALGVCRIMPGDRFFCYLFEYYPANARAGAREIVRDA
mgnify:CR=1 FL=1